MGAAGAAVVEVVPFRPREAGEAVVGEVAELLQLVVGADEMRGVWVALVGEAEHHQMGGPAGAGVQAGGDSWDAQGEEGDHCSVVQVFAEAGVEELSVEEREMEEHEAEERETEEHGAGEAVEKHVEVEAVEQGREQGMKGYCCFHVCAWVGAAVGAWRPSVASAPEEIGEQSP